MKSGLQVTRIRLMEFMNRKIDRNGLLREVILSIKMAISPLLLLKRLERVELQYMILGESDTAQNEKKS